MNLGETRVDVVVDFSKADAQAKAFMSQLSGKPVEVPVTISDKARGDAKRIMSELRAEASKKIEIPLSVKDQTAAALASINSKLAGFSKQDRTAVLKISAGQAEAELKRINGLIAKADDTEVDILVVARDKATAQLNAVNQALGNTEKKAVSAGAALRNTFGRVFAGAAFVQGIRTAIDAASDLEQSIGGVETVFGEASAPIIAFGKNAAEAVGLANDQFLSFATNIGGALKRAGLPMDEVASKTTQLITLAADLAATYGGTTAEAVTALTAAFRGEFDSLERFNTGLTQTAVNARAVDLGLSEGTGTITQYARTMATLSLVMEQTTDAQGQFARESDTAAHQQQVALAKLRDAAASLGAALLPVFTKIADVVGKVAGVFGSLPGPVQSVVVALAGLALVANPIEKVVGAVTKLGGALQKLGGGAGGLKSLFAGSAKVAAIATAVVFAGKAFESFRAHEEAVAAQSKELFDVIAQGGDVFATLTAQLNAIPNDNPIGDAISTVSLGLVEFSGTQERFDAALRKSGVTAKDVAKALDGEISPALQRLIDLSAQFEESKGDGGSFLGFNFGEQRDINAMIDIQDQAGLTADELTAFQETYKRIAETVSAAQLAKGLDQAKGAFEDFWTGAAPPPTLEEQLAQVQAAFAASVDIGDRIRAAVPDWTHVQTGMADLRRELGLVGEEFDKAAENSTAFAQTLRSEDWKSASFDSALSSIQKYQQETLGLIDLVQDRKSAITDFKDAVEGLNFDDIAASTPEAIKGLEGIAQVLSVDLANAWTQSGGDAEKFVQLSTAATDSLVGSLGLGAAEADKLKVALRATEGDFRAQVDVIIANEAILKLQLLSSTLDNLPPDVQTKIGLQIANGDFVGALKTNLDALTAQQHDVNVNIVMNTLQARSDLDGLTQEQRTAQIEAVAAIAEATGDFNTLTDEDRQARVTAIAELVEAQGGLDDLTSEEYQAIVDTIAHTTKASDSIEDVEKAKYEADIALQAILGKYNSDVAAATQPQTMKVNLDAGGVVRNVPQFVNIAARLNIPRGANIPVANGMFNPNASSPLHAFAAGGMTWDDSQANKWGAGQSMFQIREPETGGESFIPHARSKWARSRRIWWETGKALGMIAMADGGVTSMAQQVIGPYVPPTWMVDLLRRSGSSVKDFEDSLKDGPEAIDALLSKLKKQGLAADDIVKIDKELIKALNILRLQALQAAAAQQQVAQTGGGGGSDGTADTGEADAVAELNDQLVGQAEAFETATNANFQYQIALGSADWGRSAIESAEKAFGEFTDGLFAGVDATLDRQDAMKGFFDVIASSITLADGEEDPMGMVRIGRALQQINQSGGFSSLAGQARELNSALKAIAETVDEQLSQAFQDANGDSAAFLTAATAIGDKVIADMQLTGEAAEAVRAQLGLTAGDYEARFKLAGADEAFKRLSLLKTSLDALNNDELSAQIDVLIAQGDFTGALKLAQDALDKNALEVKTKANTTDTEKALKALADETRVAIIEVRLDASGIPADYASIIAAIRTGNLPVALTTHARGGTAGPWGGIAGETWLPEIVNGHVVSSPTYVSPGTQVTGVAATQTRLRTQGAHGATGGSQGTLDYNKLAQALAQALTDPMTRSLTSAVRQMVRGA